MLGCLLPLLLNAAPAPLTPPQNLVELEQALRNLLAAHRIPGCGVALVTRTQDVWIAGLGKAHLTADRDTTPDTLFRIGSTSKTFAALAVLKLQEEGRLNLNDPVRARAPALAFRNPWEESDPVRIVHLLEHTAGFDDLRLKDYAHNDPDPIPLADGLAQCATSCVSRWRPGTLMSYCNAGPSLAAYIVQQVTGISFEEYVANELFRPIGMHTATYFYPAEDAGRMARLYAKDGVTPQPYWHILVRPSGSINASARDMAACVRFYLNRGEVNSQALLRPESLERMERPGTGLGVSLGLTTGYGLCNYTSERHRVLWHGHNGGVNGGLTEMAYSPELGVGYAFMINSENGAGFEPIAELLAAFLTRDLPTPPLPPLATVDPELPPQFSGYYKLASSRNATLRFLDWILTDVHLTFNGSQLVADPLLGPARSYPAVTPRTFRSPDGPAATRAFAEVEGRRLYWAGMATFEQVPPWVAWTPRVVGGLWLVWGLSTLLFGLVWVPRWLRGRLEPDSGIFLRSCPLVATLACATAAGMLFASTRNTSLLFARYGLPTPWSMAFCGLTVLFLLAAIVGVLAALRRPPVSTRRLVRWHALLGSLLHTVVALYLLYWGVIGWRTWT